MTDHLFTRPNGKPYRPRTSGLRAHAWENPGDSRGVVVIGTLDPEQAMPLGWESAAYWYGDADTSQLVAPRPGWWRDGYDGRHEPAWIRDDDRGAPGVMFAWVTA